MIEGSGPIVAMILDGRGKAVGGEEAVAQRPGMSFAGAIEHRSTTILVDPRALPPQVNEIMVIAPRGGAASVNVRLGGESPQVFSGEGDGALVLTRVRRRGQAWRAAAANLPPCSMAILMTRAGVVQPSARDVALGSPRQLVITHTGRLTLLLVDSHDRAVGGASAVLATAGDAVPGAALTANRATIDPAGLRPQITGIRLFAVSGTGSVSVDADGSRAFETELTASAPQELLMLTRRRLTWTLRPVGRTVSSMDDVLGQAGAARPAARSAPQTPAPPPRVHPAPRTPTSRPHTPVPTGRTTAQLPPVTPTRRPSTRPPKPQRQTFAAAVSSTPEAQGWTQLRVMLDRHTANSDARREAHRQAALQHGAEIKREEDAFTTRVQTLEATALQIDGICANTESYVDRMLPGLWQAEAISDPPDRPTNPKPPTVEQRAVKLREEADRLRQRVNKAATRSAATDVVVRTITNFD